MCIQSGLEWMIMFVELTAHLAGKADDLMAPRLDFVTSEYQYPLPVFLLNRRIIVRSVQESQSLLRALHQELRARNVTRLVPAVSAMDIPRAGRFRAWVTWHELTADPAENRSSDVIYFCKKTPLGLRTEMVCYTRLSMPELSPRFAHMALSA
jgi:hypothetical protein